MICGTLSRRVAQRGDDEFGGKPAEWAVIARVHATKEGLPPNAVSIDATAPVTRVVDDSLAKCANWTGRAANAVAKACFARFRRIMLWAALSGRPHDPEPRHRPRRQSRPHARARGNPRWSGSTVPQLRAALMEAGLDEREAKMRSAQLWNWIYVNGVTDFERMSNVSKPARQMLADRFEITRPEIVTEQVSIDGTRKWLFRYRDPQQSAAAAGRDRDGLHPGGRPRHALRQLAGRLHAHLLVLPHRHAEAGAQPDAGRNPRADPDGARAARRFSGRRAARTTAGWCRRRAGRAGPRATAAPSPTW